MKQLFNHLFLGEELNLPKLKAITHSGGKNKLKDISRGESVGRLMGSTTQSTYHSNRKGTGSSKFN